MIFENLKLGNYNIEAGKEGFGSFQTGVALRASGVTPLEITLLPQARRDTVEVHDTAAPLEDSATVHDVPPETTRELPSRPATVTDTLPLVPGVIRAPGGGLNISGAGEHRSALVVNSADVTDPATGQFGLTVPIDSVEKINVFQSPFVAEYGRFTAGLVSVETHRGGEKWKWDLNDPFPDFRIRSYHLRGIHDATPRLNFEGPLITGKLYFSEGFEYLIRKTAVYTLPFPDNQTRQEGINSFAQLDWVVSGNQLATATVHLAPQRLAHVNLNFFNPQETSPNAGTHNYTTTLADHLSLNRGLWDNTLSVTNFDARIWGEGGQDLVVTPGGNQGNYFASQDRVASRLGWSSTFSFAPVTSAGVHNVKAGTYIAQSWDHGQVNEHPVDILDSSQQLLERITFSGGQPFQSSDTEYALFGQDHWLLHPRLALDYGLRAETQKLSQAIRLAPRIGLAWTPFADKGTVVRIGFGVFYDRVPLNVYSFEKYPTQTITRFDAAGQIEAGSLVYVNGLGEVISRPPFVFQRPTAGNFSPRSDSWSLQIEHPISNFLKVRAAYLQNQSAGLVILNTVAPEPPSLTGAYLLTGNGKSRYRQVELSARLRLNSERQLFFSYVRSHARGDLNDFGNYLGSFPQPIIRTNQFGNLASDMPNRFLAWGAMKLPGGFRIAPLIEYRNGFPVAIADVLQNYVGVPNTSRFPNFLSVDSRFSKDFKMNQKYTVRLSVSGYNLTKHFNPEAFHNNIADSSHGLFFGQRGRHFTADFDIVF